LKALALSDDPVVGRPVDRDSGRDRDGALEQRALVGIDRTERCSARLKYGSTLPGRHG